MHGTNIKLSVKHFELGATGLYETCENNGMSASFTHQILTYHPRTGHEGPDGE
jgi:hypothetical protein